MTKKMELERDINFYKKFCNSIAKQLMDTQDMDPETYYRLRIEPFTKDRLEAGYFKIYIAHADYPYEYDEDAAMLAQKANVKELIFKLAEGMTVLSGYQTRLTNLLKDQLMELEVSNERISRSDKNIQEDNRDDTEGTC